MDPIFTWSPRLGASGDDQFDLDFGTKMDGDFESGGVPLLGVGPITYSPYSVDPSPLRPTFAEVNAGFGFNQTQAAVNYKRSQLSGFDQIAGNPFPLGFSLSYLAPGAATGNGLKRALTSAVLVNLKAGIDQMRALEGFAAYPFTPLAIGDMYRAYVLAELRKAQALIGVSRSALGSAESARGRSDFGGLAFFGTSDAGMNAFAAQNLGIRTFPPHTTVGVGTYVTQCHTRHFLILPWMIPNWVTWNIEVVITGSEGSYNGELWLANTNRRFVGGATDPLTFCDNLVGTWTANGTYNFDLAPYASILNSGQHYATFIVCSAEDRGGAVGPDGHFNCTTTMVRDYGA